MSASVVRVTYHHEEGSWWAESPDVAGFSAAGDSLSQVRQLVREGVVFSLGRDDVELFEADAHGHAVVDWWSEEFDMGLWSGAALGAQTGSTTSPLATEAKVKPLVPACGWPLGV